MYNLWFVSNFFQDLNCNSISLLCETLRKLHGTTATFPHVVSLLQHLLLLRDEHHFAFVNHMVQQITIQTKDGNDPDISVLNLNVEKCCKGKNTIKFLEITRFLGIKDEKEVRGLKKKVDLLNEKNRTLEIRNQKDQQDLERIKNEKSELTKSLTRYQERIDKGTLLDR